MSISEIRDSGSAHPWANIRINDLTVDSNLVANDVELFNLTSDNITSTQFNIPDGTTYNLYTKTAGNITVTTITNVTVYTLQLVNGTSMFIKFYLCAKGGLPGNTNNFLVQEQSGFITVDLSGTATIVSFPITGTNIIQGVGFPTTGQVGGTLTLGGGNILQFNVINSVAVGQTTDFTWSVDIYKLQTTL